MRVLITAFAMDAHFNGVVPLAWALRTAGHEVRIASQPALTDSITRSGLTAVPVGENHRLEAVMGAAAAGVFALHQEPDYLENRPHLLDMGFLHASTTMLTATFYSQINNDAMIDEMIEFARWWQPDLVIWEPFTFAGAIAAHVVGAAHARLLWGPDLFRTVHRRFHDELVRLPVHQRDDALDEWLTWTLARHGHSMSPDVITAHWTIDQMPPSVRLDPSPDVVSMRYIPYNGPLPAVVPKWLRHTPDRPRICITQGVTERTSGFSGLSSVGEILDAVADLPVEVVLTMKPDGAEPLSAPSNVRIVDSVPLHAALPTCAVVVHHGGAGTWATAAVHGVPQLSFAWQWDDVFRSRQLAELGAGIHLAPGGASGTALRESVLALLDDRVQQSAKRLQQEMLASPPPNEIVGTLKKLTSIHRGAV
ncbi:activator-dependent family glycosyltransferase [Nocardia asteroides]